ncbi:hypothetical protein OG462_03590 [Streptomyces sp. NBC_01077]|uniref:hypothetical protein n=1 Tax=Streptomyces sp. NBC_01077 TaxID=2903746 RepID=UPI0038660A65|nr:hypothetical protein OG462_03590 [Streptomyces sp. NBC_01077]
MRRSNTGWRIERAYREVKYGLSVDRCECRIGVAGTTMSSSAPQPRLASRCGRHLLQVFSTAVENTCHQHRACLRKRADESDRPHPNGATTHATPAPRTAPDADRRTGPARAFDLARAFAEFLRHRRGFLLTQWIRQVEQDAPKPISGFAGFLRQDLDAVTA